MKPTQTLPANYAFAWGVNLKSNLRLNVILQVLGLVLMLVSGWIFSGFIRLLRPDLNLHFRLPELWRGAAANINTVLWLFVMLVLLYIVTLGHEFVHGFFFWFFTRHLPEFGIGAGYAFAAMPGWFFPRRQYLLIGLSPLLVLSALYLTVCLFLPLDWVVLPLAAMVINAGGAVGDIYICLRIASEDREVWVRDLGDGFQIYRHVDAP